MGNFPYTLTLLFISKARDMNTHGMSSIIVTRSLCNKLWNIGKNRLQVRYWNTDSMDEGTKSTRLLQSFYVTRKRSKKSVTT